tara:strand:- start:426 stop:791 length:366 start_codon:yes stop_codon:yes gene_type:complete
MTARYDWTINQGETSTLTYVRTATSGGSAVNFQTNTTFRMQVKDKYGGTAVFTSDVSKFTYTGTSSPNNQVLIKLSDTDTAAIAAGKYVYDVEAVNEPATGEVTRILEGSLIVKAGVTTIV